MTKPISNSVSVAETTALGFTILITSSCSRSPIRDETTCVRCSMVALCWDDVMSFLKTKNLSKHDILCKNHPHRYAKLICFQSLHC